MGADTLYWLYSTIAQTLGAILGVCGMVCVFRLGNLRSARWAVVGKISEFCFCLMGDYAPPAKKILEECEQLLNASRKSFDVRGKKISIRGNAVIVEKENWSTTIGVNPQLELSKLKEIVQEEDRIRPAFIRLVKATLVIIGICITALIFCEVLATTPLWIPAIGLTVWAVVYALHMTVQLCIAAIPGDTGEQGLL